MNNDWEITQNTKPSWVAIFAQRWLCLLLVSLPAFNSHSVETIELGRHNNQYAETLLRQALDATVEDYGEYRLRVAEAIPALRTKLLMQNHNIGNVLMSAERAEWNRDLIKVDIPLMKGYLGKKVLLIHSSSQALFSDITNIDELRQIPIGQNLQWATKHIFERNNFNIVISPTYTFMKDMLDKDRFKAIPKGIYQAESSLKDWQATNADFALESTIMIETNLAYHFYVNPNQPELAQRISQGLQTLIANGTFDKLFDLHFGHIEQALKLKDRKLFVLD